MLVDGFDVKETPCPGLDICEVKTREILDVPSSPTVVLSVDDWASLTNDVEWARKSAGKFSRQLWCQSEIVAAQHDLIPRNGLFAFLAVGKLLLSLLCLK